MKRLVIAWIILLLPTVCYPATRYVDGSLTETCSGSYNPTTRACSGGSSYAYQTFSAAEAACSSGDTVYARAGTYPLGCTINVANTAWSNYNEEVVTIDGDHLRPNPDDRYTPLISIEAGGVTWDGIDVVQSTGYNMHIKGASQASKISGVIVRNSNISDSLNQNMVIVNTSGLLMENCQFVYGNSQLKPSGTYDGASVDLKYSDNFTIRYNIVREAYRDGFIADVGSFDGLIEYNQFYGNRVSQCYACNSANMTIRYNLVYGCVDPENLLVDTGNAGSGIVLGSEAQWGSESSGGHKVYGNLVAGCAKNLVLATELSGTPVVNCEILNNTFIQAQKNVSTGTSANIYANSRIGSGNIFKNNIIWQDGGVIADVQVGTISFDYNYWSSLTDADAMGPHDYKKDGSTYNNGDPLLQDPAAFTWKTMTDVDDVLGEMTGQEFQLSAGSPAIGIGADLGNSDDNCEDDVTLACGMDLKSIDFKTATFTRHDRDDYNGGAWSMGADVPVEIDPGPPETPGSFSCTVNDAQKITCSWSASDGANSYKLNYSVKSGDCASTGGTVISGITSTSREVEGLIPGTQYCFHVAATNSDGDSAYASAQTPTTTAFAWDLLNHDFKSSGMGISGWSTTANGSTSITPGATGTLSEDDDSTTSPSDYRAMMSRILTNGLPLTNSCKLKMKITDVPGYSSSAPVKYVLLYWRNGVRAHQVRFAADGIRVRLSNSTDSLQSGSSAYIDEGASHAYLLQDSDGTLTIKRDGSTIYTISDAGTLSTAEIIGIDVAGTAADKAEILLESLQIGSGIGDDAGAPPTSPTGSYSMMLH